MFMRLEKIKAKKIGLRFKLSYIIIFIISLFFGVNQNVVIEKLNQTELGESKVRGYYVENNEERLEDYLSQNKSTWYVTMVVEKFQNYPQSIIIFLLILGGVYFSGMNSVEASLFSVGILTKALSKYK